MPGPSFSATRHDERVRPLVRLDFFLYFCAGDYARERRTKKTRVSRRRACLLL
ncbi:TPA_asm: MC055R [Molluscum contagiosum virus]|uniref:MC055R n=1 Tax=Molluscum contagiosum virus subtype 1 TaxID=10280 RepID=A0A7G5AX55_MCV1|nr:MC055 [Molluscum contagiosum virus subtype 1]DBA37851.1 TPA_asm: MC055R [Molluscum contagiosum virus]AQY17162.1 MC055 [Molluscum contagiosum virus subtype 1]QMV28556.1 MC055R [Molluscum contagiosum virus subtype 1]DBA38030.1 TPA_asm: MC055R [Molluscum contagiosum virus]